MKNYLREDIELIQKYFPGAHSTSLHTPFDLSHSQTKHRPYSRHNMSGRAARLKERLWNR